MNYARVKNSEVIQVGLPSTGTLKDGSTVSGYNLLDADVLAAEGWVTLVDNSPVYDSATEYLEHAGYTVGETEVTANYIVRLIPAPEPPQPTMEEYLVDLDYRVSMIELGL